ncbi:MAG TPA: BatA domain-containing protein, partial [Acidobacteriota bacterium]|nr:BatA domain-containing protein [Acidobacteriota bacterium]
MSFVNPLFLLGAIATATPILLHLIKRERAQRIEFPTLMFLRRISKKAIRFQKLRHLLLLLLRIFALLLIVLAFMRPFRTIQSEAASRGRATRAHIILLDNSMSMGYADRWDRAKRAAADIVRTARPGDKVAVLEFSDRTLARTMLGSDFTEALDQIEHGVELGDRPTRYGQ